ncbi:MAG: IMP dehydrogenase [Patescibacteria group bacterium]
MSDHSTAKETMPAVPTFEKLQKDREIAEGYVDQIVEILQQNGIWQWILSELAKESSSNPDEAYPGQGLVVTGYEETKEVKISELEKKELDDDTLDKTLRLWLYLLLLFNHPNRIDNLYKQSKRPFRAPKKKLHPYFALSKIFRSSITISDLALDCNHAENRRIQRTPLHQRGVFVSYKRPLAVKERIQNSISASSYNSGREQARNPIVCAANPEITGTPMALATLAQAHSLVCVPRDGLFSKIDRQVDLVKEAIKWLEKSPILLDKEQTEKSRLLEFWVHNLVGVLEASPEKALLRATALYEAGIRTFRIYSPEPSDGPLETLKALRQLEKDNNWEPIEIFVGQVVNVKQAIELEKAGANSLYFGIGGGGRCTTGMAAGLTINWPELVWSLRGKIKIPMIVEGGANDHIPESLAVGASGIGTAGKFAGTIETPGGYLFYFDRKTEKLVKHYFGEASNAMRALAGRIGPFGIILNSEGEATWREARIDGQNLPTLLLVLYEQMQGIVAGLVFQSTESVEKFANIAAENLVKASPNDKYMRKPH